MEAGGDVGRCARGVTMEVGEAQRLQSLGLEQCLSNAYFRSHTRVPERAWWQKGNQGNLVLGHSC